ncbi:MAG TPA: CopD family protein [Kofleriaceae bacterium]|nr:CopD family protein [Kofleriaceae bacterium]
MSLETFAWVRAGHIFGFIMWVGTMFGLYQVMFAHGRTDEAGRKGLLELERAMAMAMDVGALIAIGTGVAMLLLVEPSYLKQPWMHIKLTLVVVGMLGAHGYARVKVRKLREGSTDTPPPAIFGLLNLFLIAIIIMAVVEPLAK